MKTLSFDRTAITATDPEWELARRAWNLTVDQRPALIAVPESAQHVAAAVRYSADRGLRVAAQGTGHGAAPLGDLAGTMLIKTHKMRGLVIDPVARTAPVGAHGQRAQGLPQPTELMVAMIAYGAMWAVFQATGPRIAQERAIGWTRQAWRACSADDSARRPRLDQRSRRHPHATARSQGFRAGPDRVSLLEPANLASSAKNSLIGTGLAQPHKPQITLDLDPAPRRGTRHLRRGR
jgi:FAD binding domain